MLITGQEWKYSENRSAFKVALIRMMRRSGLWDMISFKTSSRKSLREQEKRHLNSFSSDFQSPPFPFYLPVWALQEHSNAIRGA